MRLFKNIYRMYGLEVSAAKISLISDKLMPVITEWRNRPLESVYSIVFLDAMHFKVRVVREIQKQYKAAHGVQPVLAVFHRVLKLLKLLFAEQPFREDIKKREEFLEWMGKSKADLNPNIYENAVRLIN